MREGLREGGSGGEGVGEREGRGREGVGEREGGSGGEGGREGGREGGGREWGVLRGRDGRGGGRSLACSNISFDVGGLVNQTLY